MLKESKKFFAAVAVLVGTCIGAGVLGIPYVASKSGFLVAFAYILFLGLIILVVNLYLGEVVLRTKGDHQLIGYAEKYLGKKGKHIMEFAVIFGVYAAIVAYLFGMGESLSYLFFETTKYGLYFGLGIGLGMACLLKGGLKYLKKFEKMGVVIILTLFIVIFAIFSGRIDFLNLITFNSANILLPFGVILFALLSFNAVPEVRLILKKDKKLFKKVLVSGTLVSVIFYILFTFVVLGYLGTNTPEIATLTLGAVFVILGISTMFTSYLASGNALRENFKFDERYSERTSWILSAVVPIGIFLIIRFIKFFSFTTILSIGGVVSGGIIAIVTLLMVRRARKKGDRKPEYSVASKWWLTILLGLIFVFGVVREIFLAFR